jgi:hypothetical protein
MSSIAALYNVPSTEPEFASWSFAHAAHHRDINRTIYLATGVLLTDYVLDPFDPNNPGVWLYQHQRMHENQDAILSIPGYDLLDVVWNDPQQLAGWILLNATEHMQAADILRIG